MFDYTTRIVRASAILTGSYVAGTVIDLSQQVMGLNQLTLLCAFTKGSLTSLEIKLEYSTDNTTYYQLATEAISSGVLTMLPCEYTMVAATLDATTNFVIERPIKYRYIKVSAKGTGTVDDSALAINAIIGQV